MSTEVIVALISSVSPIVMGIFAIYNNNRIISYKIDALEKKQDKHNNLIERMQRVEDSAKSAHHRCDDINTEVGRIRDKK